jgi:hypothetical protein
VDIVNEVLRPFGLGSEAPVGGSRWLQEKSDIDPDALETIAAGFLSPDPLDAVKASGLLMATVRNPKRIFKEGIYKDPKTLATEAEAMVAPESPALKELFGVTREELSDIARNRVGNRPGEFFVPERSRGSAAAKDVMTPENEARLIDSLTASERYAPRLVQGMDGWYVLDPLSNKFTDILGNEVGLESYSRWNRLTSMNSPGSPVDWEIPRGSSAYMMMQKNRMGDWLQYGGMPKDARIAGEFPEELMNVPGHPYHSTAVSKPIQRFFEEGIESTAPKVPLYRQASEAPAIGFQTDSPVPDAHWSRAIGLGDTRGGSRAQWGKSASTPEMSDLAPWWRESVARPVGLEPVPAQARTWGLFAPQTGVETVIGAPKLEIIADAIMQTSRRLDISPEEALEQVIRGTAYAGK